MSELHVLDTDICINLMKGRCPDGPAKLSALEPGQVAVTAITAAELRFGALRSVNPKANSERLALFLAPLAVLPFDDEAAAWFARVKLDLAAKGSLIGVMDMLIASVALAAGAVLVTCNRKDFVRIEGLQIAAWM